MIKTKIVLLVLWIVTMSMTSCIQAPHYCPSYKSYSYDSYHYERAKLKKPEARGKKKKAKKLFDF